MRLDVGQKHSFGLGLKGLTAHTLSTVNIFCTELEKSCDRFENRTDYCWQMWDKVLTSSSRWKKKRQNEKKSPERLSIYKVFCTFFIQVLPFI